MRIWHFSIIHTSTVKTKFRPNNFMLFLNNSSMNVCLNQVVFEYFYFLDRYTRIKRVFRLFRGKFLKIWTLSVFITPGPKAKFFDWTNMAFCSSSIGFIYTSTASASTCAWFPNESYFWSNNSRKSDAKQKKIVINVRSFTKQISFYIFRSSSTTKRFCFQT